MPPYMLHFAHDGADRGFNMAAARLGQVRQALWRREAELGLAELRHNQHSSGEHTCRNTPSLPAHSDDGHGRVTAAL